MGEVAIIPVLGREDALEHCLKALRTIRPDMPLRLFMDKGYASNNLVALQRKYEAPGTTIPLHSERGNTRVVREAMRWAAFQNWDLVHYIESDVIVTPEYFEWSREKHNDTGLFASCAWRNPTGLEQEMQLSYFSGIGACLKKESCMMIADTLRGAAEWDTQVAKLMLERKKRCAFAAHRLVAHIGWDGISFKTDGRGDTGFAGWQSTELGAHRDIRLIGSQWVLVRTTASQTNAKREHDLTLNRKW